MFLNLGVKSYLRGFGGGEVLTDEEDGIKNELESRIEDKKKNRNGTDNGDKENIAECSLWHLGGR